MTAFPHLFSEIWLGGCRIKNRIVSPGHHTYLADRAPGEALVAYHERRAEGGVGLIVSEITAVHATAGFSHALLDATDPAVIPDFARLAEAVHRHGARIFAQLFHPGREVLSARDGMMPVAYAPSAVPNERFHIMPKAMPAALIREVIAGYGRSAAHLAEAGFDGVEIVASHGYLPAQFLNPRVNLRDDDYGGDAERRLRFLRDVVAGIRDGCDGFTVGLRVSGAELVPDGLGEAEVAEACVALDPDLDYFSLVAGTSATLGGSVHIVPPMGIEHGYVAPFGAALRKRLSKPVLVSGRINQPQIAERIIAGGEADLCGMARALICDPELPAKALAGRLDDIRACIGCNQACVGRAHKGLGISCIQHPESGRELEFPAPPRAARGRRVIVAGGGPAGMKAAAVAAARGHRVTLYERARQLGGQARLAQALPGREEFGGIITNLAREMDLAGVEAVTGREVTAGLLRDSGAEAVIVATGARAFVPSLDGLDEAHCVTAWEVLEGKANPGQRVVIADWRADWIGIGLAERLCRDGCAVTLCTNAALAGETLQLYTRNHYVGRLHKLGVAIRTHVRLYGADGDSAYFQDTLSDEPVVIEGVDTLVLALGHQAETALEAELDGLPLEVLSIGDCVAPRSAEEAVYEGMIAGRKV
jgi:2,4-dienoyl-CoA reductase-like NADH-dependent reductase (Old Yellow Enzyme family)/thioredoxin reductase